MTTILLDTDIVAYKFASAAQEVHKWDEDCISVDITMSDEEIIRRTVEYIEGIQDALSASKVIVCLTDKVNFRKSVLPSYKGNRQQEKPVKLQWLKDMLANMYPSFIRPTLEADDVMGILSTHPKIVPGRRVIVSEDKDMKTIPGWLFNPAKDTKARLISEPEADWWHMYQTLVGDTTDGYKGCPKIGDVKARGILDACVADATPYWPAVVDTYVSKGLTESEAVVQARCARILRHTDYDFKRKEVKLWQPPQ